MLYTLTMHPAVDLFFTPALRSDAAVRAGGKGVNVSRFLRALGRPSRCIVLCGGARGRFLVRVTGRGGAGRAAGRRP